MRYTLIRGDDEILLDVDYTMTPYHLGSHFEPPKGGEIVDLVITGPDDAPVTLTDDEESRLCDYIYAHHEPDDGDDPDNWSYD